MTGPRYTIAHVLALPAVGGTEKATLRIAQALDNERFRHVVFCPPGATPVRDLFASEGFETASFEPVEPSYRRPAPFLRASWRLARELRRTGAELVHCADVLAAHYTAFAGRAARLPVLCHVRNRHEEMSRRDRSFLLPVSRFAFVSRDTWRRFPLKVPARRGVVVYDGLDAVAEPTDGRAARREVGDEFGIPEGAKLVGMVARVAPQKDYATLVRAARRVVDASPDTHFIVVGEHSGLQLFRDHYELVKGLVAEAGLGAHFTFTDYRADVPRLVEAFDVFVLCTHFEGLPLVIIEAMAQAKPVVATAVDGIPEIVVEGETGLLHAHEDDEGLAAKLLSLLNDGGLAARLGEAGWRFVGERFTRGRFAADMADVYLGMLGGTRGRAGEFASAARAGVE